MKASKKSYHFPLPQHFVQKKISLGLYDLFEYSRGKRGTSIYTEMIDKEVLVTTKTSKESIKEIEMCSGD